MLMGTNFAPTPDNYQWYSNRPGVDGIQSGTLGNEILVSPTDTGVFVYSYFVTIQGCNSDTSTISLRVAGKPIANDDQYTLQLNKTLDNFDIRSNDQFFSTLNRTITITQRPVNGILLRNNDGTYSYTPNKGFLGTDEFRYTICYDCNASLCDEAVVFINVEFEGDCVVPTIITPNKDAINDALQILCLETGLYPENELIIYNQWGDQVFRAKPYTNNWDGTLKGESGKDLPDGTYYYLFKLTPTDTYRKGFITVFR
jgi:gliding motility-associated-like protein